MATHSRILAWRIPWTEELGKLHSMVSQRVRHDATNTFTFTGHKWIRVFVVLSCFLRFQWSARFWKMRPQFSSVQWLSRVQLFATPWIAAHQASLCITNSRSSLKLMCIESVMQTSHLILCCPLLLLPPIPPSIRVFSNESTLHMRWPKYWSFSLGISPSYEHPGLVSFRMDLLNVLAVQGTLNSLLQHHSSKA